MAITQVTSNVIEDNTIKPNKLTTGGPVWNSAGSLSAVGFAGDGSRLTGLLTTVPLESVIQAVTGGTIPGIITAKGFIGDGSQLTDVTPALSVIEVTSNFLNITPRFNNTVILLNSLSTINITIDSGSFNLVPGHKTYFVQTNTGRGNFLTPFVYNVNSFLQTRRQYSVCELEFLGNLNGWTLYGDLTSVSLTSTSTPVTQISGLSFSLSSIDNNELAWNGLQILSATDLYSAGPNYYGHLGLGPLDTYRSVFTKVSGSWSVKSTGRIHSLALSSSNNVLFSIGRNDLGGIATNGSSIADTTTFTRVVQAIRPSPFTLFTDPRFTAVRAGYNNNSFVLSGTKLFTCGGNELGQLGLNNITNQFQLNLVTAPTGVDWSSVDPGAYFSAGLSLDNDLYTCGLNQFGQLGLNLAGGSNANPPGSIFRSTFTKITIPDNPKFAAMSAGVSHLAALSGNDTYKDLYIVGSNIYGELGLNDCATNLDQFLNDRSTFTRVTIPNNPKFTVVYAADYRTYALSGTDLYACGRNQYGELGFGDTIYRSTLTKIPGSWVAISPGLYNVIALSSQSGAFRLFSCGQNAYGELGLNDRTNRLTFTQVTGVAVPI